MFWRRVLHWFGFGLGFEFSFCYSLVPHFNISTLAVSCTTINGFVLYIRVAPGSEINVSCALSNTIFILYHLDMTTLLIVFIHLNSLRIGRPALALDYWGSNPGILRLTSNDARPASYNIYLLSNELRTAPLALSRA